MIVKMNFKASRTENLILCEQQAKLIQDRVLLTESSISELCSVFSIFARKSARLRDANDEVAKVLMTYAETETVNKTLKIGLSNIAKILNTLGDYRNLQVQRIDKKVVEVFAQYEGVCRRARDEIKTILNVCERESSHQRQLDRLIDRNPHNRFQITRTETELIKASSEVSRSQKALEEQIEVFEKNKLKDIKSTLLDFIKTELALHVKAVELYTQAYNDASEIDECLDLEDLRSVLASNLGRLDTVKRASLRSSSLQSIANLFSTPQKSEKRESSGIPTALNSESVAVNQPEVESRIISLRDEYDEDEQTSQFFASNSFK